MLNLIRDILAFPFAAIAFIFLWLTVLIGGKATKESVFKILNNNT